MLSKLVTNCRLFCAVSEAETGGELDATGGTAGGQAPQTIITATTVPHTYDEYVHTLHLTSSSSSSTSASSFHISPSSTFHVSPSTSSSSHLLPPLPSLSSTHLHHLSDSPSSSSLLPPPPHHHIHLTEGPSPSSSSCGSSTTTSLLNTGRHESTGNSTGHHEPTTGHHDSALHQDLYDSTAQM